MKNKKILYGLLAVGAIVGLYFWKKKKMPKDLRSQKEKDCANKGGTWDNVEKFCGMKLENSTQAPMQTQPISSTLNKKVCPTKVNNVKENVVKQNGSSYDKTIIDKNTIIENARIFVLPAGGLMVNFSVNKLNEFDSGGRQAKHDEFEIVEVTNISCREQIDKVLTPYAVERFDVKNGFKVYQGDIVKIKLLKDIENSIPNKLIFYN